MLEVLVWLSLAVIFYVWILFPAGMFLLAKLPVKRERIAEIKEFKITPSVSVILPVYKGSGKINEKLNNVFSIDYPEDLLEVILVLDGSPPETLDEAFCVKTELQGKRLRILALEKNRGKSAAQNAGIAIASGDIILFSDLEAVLARNVLQLAIPLFSNPKVGCVGLNVKFRLMAWDKSGAQKDYGKFENTIRAAEAKLGTLTSIFGSAFLVRKKYFRKLDEDTGDDFIIPLDLALAGYSTQFCDDAVVLDDYSSRSYRNEIRYRRRVVVRNLLGLLRRKALLNPLKYPLLSFTLWSHKLLRWFFPVFLLCLLLSSCILRNENEIYYIIFIMQILFYVTSIVGILGTIAGFRVGPLGYAAAFLVGNLGMLTGIISLISGFRVRAYNN